MTTIYDLSETSASVSGVKDFVTKKSKHPSIINNVVLTGYVNFQFSGFGTYTVSRICSDMH